MSVYTACTATGLVLSCDGRERWRLLDRAVHSIPPPPLPRAGPDAQRLTSSTLCTLLFRSPDQDAVSREPAEHAPGGAAGERAVQRRGPLLASRFIHTSRAPSRRASRRGALDVRRRLHVRQRTCGSAEAVCAHAKQGADETNVAGGVAAGGERHVGGAPGEAGGDTQPRRRALAVLGAAAPQGGARALLPPTQRARAHVHGQPAPPLRALCTSCTSEAPLRCGAARRRRAARERRACAAATTACGARRPSARGARAARRRRPYTAVRRGGSATWMAALARRGRARSPRQRHGQHAHSRTQRRSPRRAGISDGSARLPAGSAGRPCALTRRVAAQRQRKKRRRREVMPATECATGPAPDATAYETAAVRQQQPLRARDAASGRLAAQHATTARGGAGCPARRAGHSDPAPRCA